MLSASELERFACATIQSAKHGTVEDSRVELKREWPKDTKKAARRLAGHANSAQSDWIVWLIGLADDGKIVGCEPIEKSEWWGGVQSHFDGQPPTMLQDLAVPVDDKSVSVLLFDCSRPPYVWKSNNSGVAGSEAVDREVPWREATAIRSAKREEMQSLLHGFASIPVIEIVSCELDAKPSQHETSSRLIWSGGIQLYIIPSRDATVVLPYHRMQIKSTMPEEHGLRAVVRQPWLEGNAPVKLGLLTLTHSEVIAAGPGRIELTVDGNSFAGIPLEPFDLRFRLGAVNARGPIEFTAHMSPRFETEKAMYWYCKNAHNRLCELSTIV